MTAEVYLVFPSIFVLCPPAAMERFLQEAGGGCPTRGTIAPPNLM